MHAVRPLGETRRKMRPKNKARTASGGDVCDESESGATNMGVHGPTAPSKSVDKTIQYAGDYKNRKLEIKLLWE